MPSEVRASQQTAGSRGAMFAVCGAGLGLAALAIAARKRKRTVSSGAPCVALGSPKVTAARELNQGSGMLALSVLCDSALEHYRANFFNKAMYAPLVSSSLSLVASLHGTTDARQESHRLRHAIFAGAALVGLVGGGFHIYNVTKREGGFVFQNLFYAAPIGAPYALILSGVLGAAAEWVRDAEPNDPKLFGIKADRILAAIASAGLFGTAGEAGLLHFRGAFQNPAMLVPITLPPAAAALLAKAAIEPRRPGASYPLTRAWLGVTAFMGLAGVLFHCYGVARMMGGWRNWRQNLIDGPPVPAPPSFTGLALAGRAAVRLMESGH